MGKPAGVLNPKQAEFARLYVSGKTQSEAYLVAYGPTDAKETSIAALAAKVANRPATQKEIARIRARSDRHVLLSLNDRLKILGGIILDPDAKKTDVISAAAVYSRISGDQAPDRHEVTGKDGAPLQIQAQVAMVRRLSPRERLEEMRRARAERNNPAVAAIEAPVEIFENPS